LEACRELLEEQDAAIRQALEQVVEDEAHHAAFAWKVVRWAIEREGEGKVDKSILELLDTILTPAEIERIGGGRYKQEDIKLLCDLKDSLVRHYNGSENNTNFLYCGAAAESNKVSHRVMQVVC
jgi:hypothetical protein